MMLAFRSYDELKTAVSQWLMRQDLDGDVPHFIRLAEADLDRNLRVRELVERRTSIVSAQYMQLPANWVEMRRVRLYPSGRSLEFMAMAEMDHFRGKGCPGHHHAPAYYSLLGSALEFAPMPSPARAAEIEIVYYARVPKLTDDDPMNAILQQYPDLYLYGALAHSAPFLKDDERLSVWNTMYQQALAGANMADQRGSHSGGPLTIPRRSFGV